MLANEFAGTVALGDGQFFSRHLIQCLRAVGCDAGHQHIRAGQKRPGKSQFCFTLNAGADPGDHVNMTAPDPLEQFSH
ncbi:hypothetical protein D3C84_645430 [compost metagenome]